MVFKKFKVKFEKIQLKKEMLKNHFSPPAVYIWSGSQYWKLDSSYHYRKVEAAYPRPIKPNWKNAPEDADAAFSKESGKEL